MIGSIAAIFKSHFGVNVKGAAGYKKLDTRKVEVASTVNQNAEKGQPASEQISNMTAGVGIPTGMNAPFDMNQMAAMINMMGGNPMMSFMMMMMNPQFMQQMMQMQKQGATFGEASKVVAEKTEISDFDKLLEEVIENQRASLPSISRKDAIKVVKLCKNIYGAFKNIGTDMSGVTFDPDKKKAILFDLQNMFNIVKKDQNIEDDTLEKLVSFFEPLFYKVKFKENESIHKILKKEIYDVILNDNDTTFLFEDNLDAQIKKYVITKIVHALFNNNSEMEDLNEFITLDLSFELDKKYYLKDEVDKALYSKTMKDCLGKIQKVFIDNKINLDDVSKITAENKLIRNKSIIRRRPIRKNKIINESEFLKSELKRLWKL